MKKLILVLLLALLAAPALAGVKQCNSVMVNQNLCADTTQDLLYLKLAGDARAQTITALAKSVGWTANVTCSTAMVAVAQCTEVQLGQSVANPETRLVAANRALREFVQNAIRSEQAEGHRETKMAELAALLSAIGTSDVGD